MNRSLTGVNQTEETNGGSAIGTTWLRAMPIRNSPRVQSTIQVQRLLHVSTPWRTSSFIGLVFAPAPVEDPILKKRVRAAQKRIWNLTRKFIPKLLVTQDSVALPVAFPGNIIWNRTQKFTAVTQLYSTATCVPFRGCSPSTDSKLKNQTCSPFPIGIRWHTPFPTECELSRNTL